MIEMCIRPPPDSKAFAKNRVLEFAQAAHFQLLLDVAFRSRSTYENRELAHSCLPGAFNKRIEAARKDGDIAALIRISSDPTLPHTVCTVAGGYAIIALAYEKDVDGLKSMQSITRGGSRQYHPARIRDYANEITTEIKTGSEKLNQRLGEIKDEMKEKMGLYLECERRRRNVARRTSRPMRAILS